MFPTDHYSTMLGGLYLIHIINKTYFFMEKKYHSGVCQDAHNIFASFAFKHKSENPQ